MELAEVVFSARAQEVQFLLLLLYNSVIGHLPLIFGLFLLFIALECLTALLGELDIAN